jgi:hypothetical protein
MFFDRFFMRLGKTTFPWSDTLNFLDTLALKRTLYGLTQIEESPVKGIDSSA